MYRDPSEFRERFKAYKEGKSVREIYGLPGYAPGKVGEPSPDEAFVESMGPLLYRELLYQGVKNPDVVYKNLIAQLAYESDRGRSRVAREQHNYGGVGWNGKTYFNYKNDADFVHDYVKLMNRRYKTAILADTLYDYAKGIKKLGYFEDTLENYSRNLIGMKSLHKAALAHKMANPELYKVDTVPVQLAKPIIAIPDATRVSTIPTIQLQVIDYTDRRNPFRAEADRIIWAHNAMENMPKVSDMPMWENPSLPALTPVEYDVTPLKTYAGGKMPGYKDGTKMQWDADAGIWRQVMDDTYADVFNNLVITPKYIRPKFEYETNPNYQLPNKNEVVKQDETLWTRQQVEKANNTRTWRSDAADAMKYVQYASDAAGLLYGIAPGIKQRAAKAIYRNVVPASYKDSYLPGGKKQEAINAIKDFFTPKKLDLDNSAYRKWEQENLSLFFTDTDPVAARDEIYKKYLGLPNDDFYYIKNADGTYSHNLANHEPHDIVTIINNTYNNDMGLSGKNQVIPDMLNSAGGWVNTSLKKVNDVLARFKYKDVWDVNPFQDADRVGNVFPKKLLNKYSHIEKLANGEEARVWNKDVPWFIKKLQNFELSDFTNGAPVPVKTDINVRLLNPEEYSYTKKLTDAQIIEKMKRLDLSDAYDLYGDAMSDGIISEADWNEIELRVADKVYDTFYKDPNKYRKMFVYNVNHPLKKLFNWYGPFVLLRGYKDGKISIKPSKRGTFTAAAKKHGASVAEFERRVLKNPEKYSKAMVKKARFSHNARSWKH